MTKFSKVPKRLKAPKHRVPVIVRPLKVGEDPVSQALRNGTSKTKK